MIVGLIAGLVVTGGFALFDINRFYSRLPERVGTDADRADPDRRLPRDAVRLHASARSGNNWLHGLLDVTGELEIVTARGTMLPYSATWEFTDVMGCLSDIEALG